MSIRHHKAIKWEKTLKAVFDKIDHDLEVKYGSRYPLHPVRPEKGRTSNPQYDGLFNIGAAFSAGFGSKHGRGYIVQLKVATLSSVPADVIEEIEEFIVNRLKIKLPLAFPGRELKVTRDGAAFKIHGDLSLGTA